MFNTSGLSVSVNITLQIAPTNTDAFYVNDGSTFNLIGQSSAIFVPTRFMKYARINVFALALANVTVYYFYQT